ncbi:hypothetical protein [Mesorhizobium sp. f-mel]
MTGISIAGCGQRRRLATMFERREYETAQGNGRPAQRMVKLPGEAQHAKRGDTAKVIVRRIALDKAEKRLKRLADG